MSTESVKEKLAAKADKAVTAPRSMGQDIASYLEAKKHELALAVPGHTAAERKAFTDKLLRLAVGTINRNPKLGACTKMSLLTGIVVSTQLGLELNTPLGHAYLIPYQRSVKTPQGWTKVDEAQFQMGYQGIIELAYRTGEYKHIQARCVFENDEFSYHYGLHPDLTHIPNDEDPGPLKGVYATYLLKNGGENFSYWSVSKIMAHAKKYSKSWNEKDQCFQKGSAWGENFDSMARVPVLKDLLKLAPKSIEFARQLSLDGSTKAGFAQDMTEVRNLEEGDFLMDPADYSVEAEVVHEEGEVAPTIPTE